MLVICQIVVVHRCLVYSVNILLVDDAFLVKDVLHTHIFLGVLYVSTLLSGS